MVDRDRVGDDRFEALAEASPAATFMLRNGVLVYVNPACASITGYGRDELLGRDPFTFLEPAEQAAARQRQLARERGELGAARYEVRVRTRSGHERWLDLTTAPVELSGGPGLVGVGIDITERKQLESTAALRQQLEAVGRLAGGVAHHFNNLVHLINGESERVLEGLPPAHPLRESAEMIAEAGRRAAALTQHLLAFGRRQTIIAVPVDLNAVVAELRTNPPFPLPPNVHVDMQLGADLPPVRFARALLDQVLASLAANAVEAMPDGGTIRLSTDRASTGGEAVAVRPWLTAGEWVRLQVSDSGAGISPDVLPRVFEPFFTTKTAGAGNGLGLSTVYGIVKQSGGFVWIDSTPGRGTQVTMLLPPAETAEQPVVTAGGGPVANRRVLIVEDESGIRTLLTSMLTRGGLQVTAAASAEEALTLADQTPCDLLLTDVVLPGMKGPELARRICQRHPGVKVLFMSGYTGDALADQGDVQDPRAFIQKPFTARELLARVQEILRTTRE